MRAKKVWARLLGVEGAVVDGVRFADDVEPDALVVTVHPRRGHDRRCPHCERRCPGFDGGEGLRRWRAPDVGNVMAYVEAEAPRVRCAEHGVVVAQVPWARHQARFTRTFEDHVAWLTVHTDKTTVSAFMRVSWRSVGRILERVSTDQQRGVDRLEGLRRIGIDEVSYRKGHRYITMVVDHDTGRLVWAREGRNKETLRAFFDEMGEERSRKLRLVSADAAEWIKSVVKERCPRATLCLDPFHVVKWATDALDAVRREMWNELRRSGQQELADSLKGSRYALWKNPENLTALQQAKLSEIERANKPLHRAYLLKEQLREVFRVKGWLGMVLLERWLSWAQCSRLAPFVSLARTIRKHTYDIGSTLLHGLSNARLESMATKLRVLHRQSFGFHSAQALIDLALLKHGGLCPRLAWQS